MMACRVGPSGIYRPLVWLTLPLVLGVAWLAIDLGPRALLTVERIGAEARREADLASIEPGRFTVFGPSRAVVYGERVTADGRLLAPEEALAAAKLLGADTLVMGSVEANGNGILVRTGASRVACVYPCNARRGSGTTGT